MLISRVGASACIYFGPHAYKAYKEVAEIPRRKWTFPIQLSTTPSEKYVQWKAIMEGTMVEGHENVKACI